MFLLFVLYFFFNRSFKYTEMKRITVWFIKVFSPLEILCNVKKSECSCKKNPLVHVSAVFNNIIFCFPVN